MGNKNTCLFLNIVGGMRTGEREEGRGGGREGGKEEGREGGMYSSRWVTRILFFF